MDQLAQGVQEAGKTLSSSLYNDTKAIAALLAQSVSAERCYLLLSETKQYPLLIIASDATNREQAETLHWLRQIHERSTPIQTTVNRQPALVLPINDHQGFVGVALLQFSSAAVISVSQAQATATLVARALRATTQRFAPRQAASLEQTTSEHEHKVLYDLIHTVIDSIPVGLVLLNAQGMVLAINSSLAGLFDKNAHHLIGTHYGSLLGDWEASPAARTFATGVRERMEHSLIKADGSTMMLEIVSIPLLDGKHQVLEAWEDITYRASLQVQLVRAEKLAAIGQLAASIAHEVGNPLQAIQGFISLFLEQCPPHMPNRDFLELAEGEIDRIVEVIDRLRDLYRTRVEATGPANVNEIIEKVLLLTNKQLEHQHIRTMRDLDPALPEVEAVSNQLTQVLLNLVLNAIDAMSENGILHIRTSSSLKHPQGAMVVVEVTDTGVGIAHDQLPYIFDGLHTTKEHGMGQGLYTSKIIVEGHRGYITVQSVVGQGTTFTIMLPAIGSD